MTKLALRAF